MPPGFIGLKDCSINLKVPGEILKFDICPWPEYFVLADFWFTYSTLKCLVPWSNFKPLETETTVANIKRKKFGAARLLHFRSSRTFFFSFLFFTAKVALSEKITPAAPRCHSCEGVIRLWILSKVLKHFDKRHHKMVRSPSCPSPRPCILPRGRFSSVFNSPGVWEERTGRWKLERNMARK